MPGRPEPVDGLEREGLVATEGAREGAAVPDVVVHPDILPESRPGVVQRLAQRDVSSADRRWASTASGTTVRGLPV